MSRPKCQPSISVPSTGARQRQRARDWPRPPRRDPHVRVIAHLVQIGEPDMSVIASSSRPWASATFLGAQHRIVLRFSGADAHSRATCFAEALPEAEFSISGHIVADACVDEWRMEGVTDEEIGGEAPDQTQETALLRISVLTVEDW